VSAYKATAAVPARPGVAISEPARASVEVSTGGSLPGPPGPPGGTYRHVQTIPATTWTIVHNLGFRPNVTVVDTAGEQVEGEVDYVSETTVVVTFTAAFAGDAYLS
jgi:hypothetical protein